MIISNHLRIPLMECVKRFSGRTEMLVQLEWMTQNGYAERREEPIKYTDAEEATKAARDVHSRFLGKRKKNRMKTDG